MKNNQNAMTCEKIFRNLKNSLLCMKEKNKGNKQMAIKVVITMSTMLPKEIH